MEEKKEILISAKNLKKEFCMGEVYKIKRTIDAKHLNEDLHRFQNRLKNEV